jgi:hypothetical protein
MKITTSSKNCRSKQSGDMREADVVAECKDRGEVSGIRVASGNSQCARRAGRTPGNMPDHPYGAEVLRLRGCFASRTSRSAQDDNSKRLASEERSE